MDREQKSILALMGCLIGGVLLLGVCVVGTAGYVLWQLRPVPFVSVAPPSNAYPNIKRVSAESAYTAYTDGTAVFVDARSLSRYEAEHIRGALSIPVDEIEARQGELAPEAWIITYCT